MNRNLLIALVVVGGLAAWMGGQGDDDLLASQKGGKAPRRHEREQNADVSSAERPNAATGAGREAKGELMAPWVAATLMGGVQRWQERGQQRGDVQDGVAVADQSFKPALAWASTAPPPQPPIRQRVEEVAPPPPPPPMAPRFPHAWVGRFNDDAPLQAASSASAPPPVARAVLTSPQSTWVVRVGDVIEGQWRIDRIQDRTMSLTYLPLQQQQTVVMR
ncbi:MAG: hypothetical protein EPO09_17735 [Aquabacterium sp.]|uniref:hypothetical protein n=1 Tax=Aquabacterium sp. TaxID=1872578 RepID=UPI0011F52D9B|nr:hypothetical protein [Aquabacterium sp.]TAK88738.1 MAG: hypothetical protein EPO09_17735 [Aquabacterium sp.]